MQQHPDEPFIPFLNKTLESQSFKVFPLAGDASNRRYYRIVHDQHSWVLMRWDPFNPDEYPFLSVLNHFQKAGVRVPEVRGLSPQEGYVLLEDLGDLTLERKFWESQNQEASLLFYQMAIDEIVKIHHVATETPGNCTAFKIQFDTEKFMWELNYGKDNLILGLLRFDLNAKAAKELEDCFYHICSTLDKEPKKISHRDYHSRNLMIKLDQMSVIDFQDARLGPIQYDLVSLFKDSYVDLNETMVSSLTEYYLAKSEDYLPKDFSKDKFLHIYELQSIQRCFKACGSFASFYHQRGDRRYLKYLSHTLRRVMKSISLFPQYKVFSDILIDSGALDRNYDGL